MIQVTTKTSVPQCGSDVFCSDVYRKHPARERMRDVPKSKTKMPLQPWIQFDAEREGASPIEYVKDGGGCDPKCTTGVVWEKQIIELADEDAITDSADAYYYMKAREIAKRDAIAVIRKTEESRNTGNCKYRLKKPVS